MIQPTAGAQAPSKLVLSIPEVAIQAIIDGCLEDFPSSTADSRSVVATDA